MSEHDYFLYEMQIVVAVIKIWEGFAFFALFFIIQILRTLSHTG